MDKHANHRDGVNVMSVLLGVISVSQICPRNMSSLIYMSHSKLVEIFFVNSCININGRMYFPSLEFWVCDLFLR